MAAALLLLAASAPGTAQADPASATRTLERAVADAVNAHRAAAGLPELAWSERAAGLAREHSAAMAAGRAEFGHDGFEQRTRTLRESLPLRRAAENVSMHSARPDAELVQAALDRWLASRVHRRNIEGPFQLSGVGAARATDGSVFFTQIFVATQDAASLRGGIGSAIAGRALVESLAGLLGGPLGPAVVGLRAVDRDARLAGAGPTAGLALAHALGRGRAGERDEEEGR